MKTIREIFQFSESVESAVAALEAREKERDAAERERVKSALKEWVSQACKGYATIGSVLDAAYPPPKPETLPDGYYWCKAPWAKVWSGIIIENHVPLPDHQYRPANDPPPEVTGKAEPIGQFTCCACEKTFPMISRSAHVATICTGCYVSGKAEQTGEPITLNWLKSTNAELVDLTWQEPHPGDIRIGDLYLYGESFHGRWRFCIYMDGKAIGKIETRGDLRRLCCALGIELKEGGE